MIEDYMETWINRIIEIEGVQLMPYRNVLGKTYIGVRRCLTDFPLNADEKRALGDYMHGITKNGAKMLLRTELRRCYDVLKRQIKAFEKIPDERQFALLYFCWNSAEKGLRKHYRLIKYAERGNFVMATYEFLQTPYAQNKPKRAKKIASALKTGVWPLR